MLHKDPNEMFLKFVYHKILKYNVYTAVQRFVVGVWFKIILKEVSYASVVLLNIFFRIPWWIESSKEQLKKSNKMHVFQVTFDQCNVIAK